MTAPEDRQGRGYVTQATHNRLKRKTKLLQREYIRRRERANKMQAERDAALEMIDDLVTASRGEEQAAQDLKQQLANVTRERDEAREDAGYYEKLLQKVVDVADMGYLRARQLAARLEAK